MNYIVSRNTRHEIQHGRHLDGESINKGEKHNKTRDINNCRYVKGELVSFCEQITYRGSSTMFKLHVLIKVTLDDVTNATVGGVVFIKTYFHSLIFHQFDDKL